MDIFTKEQRSSLMAKVRVKDTDIERILVRLVRPLWKTERYRKNVRTLPGKPDIVFVNSKLAIFADGDFWHGKDFAKWKAKIPPFWREKIAGNVRRDRLQGRALKKAGYRVLRFYGSELKQKPEKIAKKIAQTLG